MLISITSPFELGKQKQIGAIVGAISAQVFAEFWPLNLAEFGRKCWPLNFDGILAVQFGRILIVKFGGIFSY